MNGAPLDPAGFRAQFPVLQDTIHLASCSLAPRSRVLDTALSSMLETLHKNPTPWEEWFTAVEDAKALFAELIGASAHEVAAIPSATVGAYQVASTLDWGQRPRLVSSGAEYSSVAQVWLAQRARGADVHVLGGPGEVPVEDCARAVDERTGLVSVPLAVYPTGARIAASEVVRAAHERGARVFVDAYQALGAQPVDVRELGCDYLVSGTMKYLLGLPGIAFLYARGGVTEPHAPQLTGWYGRENPLAFDPRSLDVPTEARRFQITLPTLPAVFAARSGLELLRRVDMSDVAAHIDRLVTRTQDRLGEAGVAVASPQGAGQRGHSVAVPCPQPRALVDSLNDRRIFPAWGHTVRLSYHYFNDDSDVDAACDAIVEYLR